MISFAWIFFRANHISDAFLIIRKIIFTSGPLFTAASPTLIPYSVLGILVLLLVEVREEYFPGRFSLFENRNVYIRYVSYAIVVMSILLLGVFDGGQFIYFQF